MSCAVNTVKNKIESHLTRGKAKFKFINGSYEIQATQQMPRSAAWGLANRTVKKVNAEFKLPGAMDPVSMNNAMRDVVGINVHVSKRLKDAYDVKEGEKPINEIGKENLFSRQGRSNSRIKDAENEIRTHLNKKKLVFNPNNLNEYVNEADPNEVYKKMNSLGTSYTTKSNVRTLSKSDTTAREKTVNLAIQNLVQNQRMTFDEFKVSFEEAVKEANRLADEDNNFHTPAFTDIAVNDLYIIGKKFIGENPNVFGNIPHVWGELSNISSSSNPGKKMAAGVIDMISLEEEYNNATKAKEVRAVTIGIRVLPTDDFDTRYDSYRTQETRQAELLRQQTGVVPKGIRIFPIIVKTNKNGEVYKIEPRYDKATAKLSYDLSINPIFFNYPSATTATPSNPALSGMTLTPASIKEPLLGQQFHVIMAYKMRQKNKLTTQRDRLINSISNLKGRKDRVAVRKTQILLSLERQIEIVDVQMRELMKKEAEFNVFSVIEHDVKSLKLSIDSGDTYDMIAAADGLAFYEKLAKNFKIPPGMNDANSKEASKQIQSLVGLITTTANKVQEASKDKILDLFNDDPEIKDMLDYLNSQEALRIRHGKVNGALFTVKDLITSVDDISMLAKNFLDIIANTTGDTYIPSYLYKEFIHNVNDPEQMMIAKREELAELNKKHGKIDKDALFSKSKKPQNFIFGPDGEKLDVGVLDENYEFEYDSEDDEVLDGYLVDAFTPKWYHFNEHLRKLSTAHANSPTPEIKTTTYLEQIKYLKENTYVINFFMLPKVKEEYGMMPEYATYFTASDTDMKDYERGLKDKLGPKYDVLLSKIMNNLARFQQLNSPLGNPRFDKMIPRNLARNNHWEFLDKYLKGDTSPNAFSIGGKDYSTHFTDIMNVVAIPKDAKYYTPEFEKVKNSPALSEFWKVYNDIGSYVNSVYGNNENGRVEIPHVKTGLADYIAANLTRKGMGMYAKRGWNIFSAIFKTLFSYLYKSHKYNDDVDKIGLSTKAELMSNYPDTFKRESERLSSMDAMMGMNERLARKEAIRSLNKTYLADIDTSFVAVFAAAALHESRHETEPLARLASLVYNNLSIDTKKYKNIPRANGIERLDFYVKDIVLNNPDKPSRSSTVYGTAADSKTIDGIMRGKMVDETIINMVRTQQFKSSARRRNWWKRLLFKSYSAQDKLLLDKFVKLREKGFKDGANFEINETIKGKEYYLKAESKDGKATYRTNIKIDPSTGLVDLNQEHEINDFAEEIPEAAFREAFDHYAELSIMDIGNDLSFSSIAEGLAKWAIISGLSYNPIVGIKNRLDGCITNFIMDRTGEYSTPGNSIKSKQFLAFSNMLQYLPESLANGIHKSKVEQMNIFRHFLDRFGGVTEKQDTLQEPNRGHANVKGFLEKSAWQWSVSDPEFKNQGEIVLNQLQDHWVTNTITNQKHRFFDPKTNSFPALEIVNGVLQVKKGFEFSFTSDSTKNLRVKCEIVKQRYQGNYFKHSIMLIRKRVLGKVGMLFHGFVPEQTSSKWNPAVNKAGALNIDPATGKIRRMGWLLNGLINNTSITVFSFGVKFGMQSSILASVMGILGGLSFTFGSLLTLSAIGLFVLPLTALTAIVGHQVLSHFFSKDDAPREKESLWKMLHFIESVLVETYNFHKYTASSVAGKQEFRGNLIFGKKAKGVSSEESFAALKAMAADLAAHLSYSMWIMLIDLFLYDDDDDPNALSRRTYNTFSNVLNSIQQSQELSSGNPAVWRELFIANLLLRDVYILINALAASEKGNWAKAGLVASRVLPIPSMIRNRTDYFFNDYNLPEMSNTNQSFKLLGKASENIAGEESPAGKEMKQYKKDLRTETKEKFITDPITWVKYTFKNIFGDENAAPVTSNSEVLSIIADNIIEERMPRIYMKDTHPNEYGPKSEALDFAAIKADLEKNTELAEKRQDAGLGDGIHRYKDTETLMEGLYNKTLPYVYKKELSIPQRNSIFRERFNLKKDRLKVNRFIRSKSLSDRSAMRSNAIKEANLKKAREAVSEESMRDGCKTSLKKGGKWKLIKDLKDYPTHEDGGVDLVINKDGVRITSGKMAFTAEKGLLIPSVEEEPKPKPIPKAVFQNSPAGLMIPEVDVVAEKPAWQQYKEDYEIENPKKDYINNYLTDFARGVGNNEEHYPSRLDREYEDLALDYSGNKLAEANPQGDRNRGEWLDSMDEKDEELIKRNPKYQSTLYADTKRGFQSLLANPGDAVSSVVDETGFSRREKADIIKEHLEHPYISKLADAGDLMSVLDVPAKAVQSVYKRDYTLGDAVMGKKNDAGLVESVATDALAGLLTGGASAVGKVAGKAGVKAGKAVGQASVKAGKAVINTSEKVVDKAIAPFKTKVTTTSILDENFYKPMKLEEIDVIDNLEEIKIKNSVKPNNNISTSKLIVGSISDDGYLSQIARGKKGVNQTVSRADIEGLQSRNDITKGDKYITKKVLDEKFKGVDEIDYKKFKEEVSKELFPLETKEVKDYADHGISRLKYRDDDSYNSISRLLTIDKNKLFYNQRQLNHIIEEFNEFKIKNRKDIEILKEIKGNSFFEKESYIYNGKRYNTLEKAKRISDEKTNYIIDEIQRYENMINSYKIGIDDNRKNIKEYIEALKNNDYQDNKTILFKNQKDLKTDNLGHFTEPNLFHSRYLISKKEPNVFHILESQSDAFQKKSYKGKYPFVKNKEELIELNRKNKEYYQQIINDAKISINEDEGYLRNAENILSLYDENPNYHNTNLHFDSRKNVIIYIDEKKKQINDTKKNIDILIKKADKEVKVNNQLGALYDKHQERMMQEIVDYAANNGQKIIRYPTAETSAAIQGYSPVKYESKFKISNYHNQHQTILKKYEEMPKNISKVLGIKKDDIRLATDSKGNSWHEFDIPKSFLEGKGKIKAFTTLPVGAAGAAAALKDKNKKEN